MTNFLFKFLIIFIIFYLTGNFDLFSAFCDNSDTISETDINQKPQEAINNYTFYLGISMFVVVIIVIVGAQEGPDYLTEALRKAADNTLIDRVTGVDNTYIYDITGYPEQKGE